MKIFTKFGLLSLVVLCAAAQPHAQKEGCKEVSQKKCEKQYNSGQKFKHEERFPADYFLIHKNMPHYMQIFNLFENDTALALSELQKEKIHALRERVVIKVAEVAHKIKALEEELQKKVIFMDMTTAEIKPLVVEIANLRTELTLSHIECIQKTRALLTEQQHNFFLEKLEIEK
mgnify:CR=1 FL=1